MSPTNPLAMGDILNWFYVSYDLIKRKDYPDLWKKLRDLGAKRVLFSVWLIKHSENATAMDVLNVLTQYIDSDDRMFVIKSADSAWIRSLEDPKS